MRPALPADRWFPGAGPEYASCRESDLLNASERGGSNQRRLLQAFLDLVGAMLFPIAARDFLSRGHRMVTEGGEMSERIAKLTKRVVDAAAPRAERYVIWDSALKGFGLRVEPSGTKTFLVRFRAAGRRRFVAVGRFGPLTPEQARGLSQGTLAHVRTGHDPAEERRRERAAITVADLARRFLAEHVGPKRKRTTAIHYQSLIERYLFHVFVWRAHGTDARSV